MFPEVQVGLLEVLNEEFDDVTARGVFLNIGGGARYFVTKNLAVTARARLATVPHLKLSNDVADATARSNRPSLSALVGFTYAM